MANIIEDNGSGFPKNRKREFRGSEIASNTNVVFFLLDPSKKTKIQVNKNSEEVEIQSSSDTKLLTGTQIDEINVSSATILFNVVDANSTTDYYASDDGVSILKLTSSGTPGTGTVQYNVTQDGN